MVRFLGFVTSALLVALPASLLAGVNSSTFLIDLARNQSVGVMGTILALNIATVTFLLSHLSSIESKHGSEVFSGTKKEIRLSAYAIVVIFIMNISLVSYMPTSTSADMVYGFKIVDLAAYVSLVFLVLMVFALIDLMEALFRASRHVAKK